MPTTEQYQVDIFAIVVLIVAFLLLVYLIIVAIYTFNLMNLVIPSRSESTALFWSGVILGVIVLAVLIYAFVEIFTHKSIVYDEEKHKFAIETVGRIPIQTAVPTIAVAAPNPVISIATSSPFTPTMATPEMISIPANYPQ